MILVLVLVATIRHSIFMHKCSPVHAYVVHFFSSFFLHSVLFSLLVFHRVRVLAIIKIPSRRVCVYSYEHVRTNGRICLSLTILLFISFWENSCIYVCVLNWHCSLSLYVCSQYNTKIICLLRVLSVVVLVFDLILTKCRFSPARFFQIFIFFSLSGIRFCKNWEEKKIIPILISAFLFSFFVYFFFSFSH